MPEASTSQCSALLRGYYRPRNWTVRNAWGAVIGSPSRVRGDRRWGSAAGHSDQAPLKFPWFGIAGPIRKQLDRSRQQDNLWICVTTPGNMARRILVVDDESIVNDSIQRVLALDQHVVETVTSAQDALVAFQPGKFDLIIIDYEMPDTKGDKLAAAIKALAPGQPILMITAYAETLRLAGIFPLSVDSVMSKPFEIREFRETVHQLATRK